MTQALHLLHQKCPQPIPPSFHSEQAAHERMAFEPMQKQGSAKICLPKTHTYLIGARGTGDARKSEAEIAAHLEKLSGGKDHLRDGIFIVDQMVYIELHAS